MNLGQLGTGAIVLVIVVFALLTSRVNTPEAPAPADDADRSIGVDVIEPDADGAPPEVSDPGTEQEPVITDDNGTDGSGNDDTANESGSESGTFKTVETGDDDTDSPTRTTRSRGSPVGVSDYNDGDGGDGSSDDSSSDDSTDDSSTDGSTDDASSDDSTDDAGDDTGDDSGDDSSGGDSGGGIGMCTV